MLMMINRNIAASLGLNEAIIINHFFERIGQAETYANDKYYGKDVMRSFIHHRGQYWHKASISSLCEVFPFWSEMTIKRTMSRLEKLGVLESTKVNDHNFDRTKSYRVNNDVLENLMSKV